jgi:hypothetical protein
MNDSHDYLGNRNNWWSQGRVTATGSTDVKTVPAATATAAMVAAGEADSGTATTLVDAALIEADDVWNGNVIKFTNGANNGLFRTITDFVDGTNTLTFAPAVPAAVGIGDTYDIVASVIQWRLVVTGYHIAGVNTGAAFAEVAFRHKISTANVLLNCFVPATNGDLIATNGRSWIPMEAGESLEAVVSGTLTAGAVAWNIWGKVFPSTTPLAMKYLGDATNP